MADLSELLGQVMSNPQMMAQMAALAQSLGLQGNGQFSSQPPFAAKNATYESSSSEPVLSVQQPANADPQMLMGNMLRMVQHTSGNQQQLALIQALKPFLRPDRIRKLERAVQVARMSRLAEQALHTLSNQAGDSHV